MRTLLAFSALAVAAAAGPAPKNPGSPAKTEKISFKLPTPGGRSYGVHDFKSRYLLIVYQGIP